MKPAREWPEGPLVLGRDKEIAEFVSRRIRQATFGPCTTMGVIRQNKLIGGLVFHEYVPAYKSVMVSYAFDRPSWATPSVLHSVALFVFDQLGCNRLCTLTPRKNKRSRRFVEGIGFKYEGCARKGFGADDAIIYGMLRQECRWLKGKEDGKEHAATAAAA